MKHLKAYKIFESIDYNEVTNTIHDILLELSDEGFETRVTNDFNQSEIGHFISEDEVPENTIYVSVGKTKSVPDGHGGMTSAPSEIFTYNDISDVMYRMYQYITSVYRTVHTKGFHSMRFGYLDEWEELHTYRLDTQMLERHFNMYYKDGGYFEIAIMIEPKKVWRY